MAGVEQSLSLSNRCGIHLAVSGIAPHERLRWNHTAMGAAIPPSRYLSMGGTQQLRAKFAAPNASRTSASGDSHLPSIQTNAYPTAVERVVG